MAIVSRTTTTYSYRHLSRRNFNKETTAFAANTFSCSAWVSAKKPSPTPRIVTRGGRVIVAASPPTKDVVVVTYPLTKKYIVDYLASGFCGHANDNSATVVVAISAGNKAEGNDGGATKKCGAFRECGYSVRFGGFCSRLRRRFWGKGLSG
ncbi:hypothetical protein LR48_Vigan05g222900 [Vigna angularis]|uniref:Uncharacterized protein n=1 Tax=Phaseolus angularis TaxID=3914 RepID=A0A0L9UQ12_PHAAN|nr:uncharacterized protein HKW66_Vig0211660 [Vigna angularis]KOM44624.1 hypothetical protein LR48_Vigan05g222900 [Vigna angularis]